MTFTPPTDSGRECSNGISRFSSVRTIAVRLSNSSLGIALSMFDICLTCTMLDAQAVTRNCFLIFAKLSCDIDSVAGWLDRLPRIKSPASWSRLEV